MSKEQFLDEIIIKTNKTVTMMSKTKFEIKNNINIALWKWKKVDDTIRLSDDCFDKKSLTVVMFYLEYNVKEWGCTRSVYNNAIYFYWKIENG